MLNSTWIFFNVIDCISAYLFSKSTFHRSSFAKFFLLNLRKKLRALLIFEYVKVALNCKLQIMFKMNVFVNRYIRNIVCNVFLRYCRLLLLSYRINLLKSCSVRQGLEPSMF